MEHNNKYIGTIISDNKVIFKVNDNVYIKRIKEKGKFRVKKYAISESVNIICDDLNKDYVLIDSDNHSYFNKTLFILIELGTFVSVMTIANEKLFFLSILCMFISVVLLFGYAFYCVLGQHKKIYKRFTETVEGEIIDYSRTEYYYGDYADSSLLYNIMYKYKTPDGTIIHSVANSVDARVLYKDYPLNKKVLIKYNPLRCCESCLLDEYNGIYGKKILKIFLLQ